MKGGDKEWRSHASPAAMKADSCVVCTTKLSSSTQPQLLPCLHMKCKACVITTPEGKASRECPLCKQSFILSEVTDCFIFKDSAPKCGGCDESVLTGWCQECEEALCSDCVSAHQRVKVTRNHTVIPQDPQSGLSTSLHCTSHKQERLKFFCVTCNQLTCRDCQLFNHRNHSFLMLEEAVVSQKEQLMKLLDNLREQQNCVRGRIHDLDGRLNDMKELKRRTEKQLIKTVNSLYACLKSRCFQLTKELENLCEVEEKSLKVMKEGLKNLEERQEYMTAFIHKILSTEGQCILRHKIQIEKWSKKVLSQKKYLPDTVIHLSLSLDPHFSHAVKNFGSFKVTRAPLSAKGKNNGNNSIYALKEADKCRSELDAKFSDTTPVTQLASNLPRDDKFELASSKKGQTPEVLTDIIRHASFSGVSHYSTPLQTTQSNNAQCVDARVGQNLSTSISAQPSQTQQVFRSQPCSLPSTSLQQSCSLFPSKTVLNIIPLNLPKHGSLLSQALSQSQSSDSNSITNTPSHPLTTNPHPLSLLNMPPFPHSSTHIPQSISHSQMVSSQCFPLQVPTNNFLPDCRAVPNTQLVNVQLSQSPSALSSDLQMIQLRKPNNSAALNSGAALKLYNYTPVFTLNNAIPAGNVRQPAHHLGMKGKMMKVSYPQPPELMVLPVSTNKQLDSAVSKLPPRPVAAISCEYDNAAQIERATQRATIPSCEVPVKAPADSVCEGESGACSRVSPVDEKTDNNLPASTVPEKNTKFEELPAVLTQFDLPLNQGMSTTEGSSTKHWLKDLPSSFREILSTEIRVSACSRSALDRTSLPNSKLKDDGLSNDSELVKRMDESEENLMLRQDSNKTPVVSLLRLPISGSSLSHFRVVSSRRNAEILVEEIEENQPTRRYFRISEAPAAASPSHSCSSACSLQSDILDCAVCLSAGASVQCSECGRSFHTTCHVPPILSKPIVMWVCSLCQDVSDDTDPFSYDRLKEPYLSLSDQRKCEQLVMTLMCDKHSYLIYRIIKRKAGCVEFNLIVERLLGKRNPPYRSAAEMVSDLWALFENLNSYSKKKELVSKLQSSFQQRLEASFGKSLHTSLLRPLNSVDQMGAVETAPDKDKTKKTLKRMKEFLAANFTPKKACT